MEMIDRQIEKITREYRNAIEAAHDDGRFIHDFGFDDFPRGSCGDASYLLAQQLSAKCNIKTIWYSSKRGDWSHAWLVVKDDRVKEPTIKSFKWPEEIWPAIGCYGVNYTEQEKGIKRYEAADLQDGVIIDITGDQFDDYDISVYVGVLDGFHKSFDFIQAHDYYDFGDFRLHELHQIIDKYL